MKLAPCHPVKGRLRSAQHQVIDRLITEIITEQDFQYLKAETPANYRATIVALGKYLTTEIIQSLDNQITIAGGAQNA